LQPDYQGVTENEAFIFLSVVQMTIDANKIHP